MSTHRPPPAAGRTLTMPRSSHVGPRRYGGRMVDRKPALSRLDVLAGRWTVQVKIEGLGTAWTEFSWDESGAYLRQYSDVDELPETTPAGWRENVPFPTTALIGLDD